MKVQLLSTKDIFDFYGCEFLVNNGHVEEDDRSHARSRIGEIHEKYLTAVKERLRAEFRFLGIENFEISSIKKLVTTLQDTLNDSITEQVNRMGTGKGFNMGQVVAQANQMAGREIGNLANEFRLGVPEEETKKKSIDPDSIVNNPKWETIAQTFIELEEASSTKEKVLSIDKLNGLQHNSFHLLIDLQTGRMLEGNSEGEMHGKHEGAVQTVKEVLDIKRGAKTPLVYSTKMSSDIAKMLRNYRFLLRGK
jgi:hypothetical protein